MLLRICLFCLFIPLLHAWSHLELGAGNYGASRSAHHQYDPNVQYRVLFWTLEELVDRYGDEGVFYVNDVSEESCQYCVYQLQCYVDMQGYPIQVIPLTGDYQTLEWDGPLFDSIHLKNPEPRFFKNRDETRKFLTHLASYSQDGLYLFILYSDSFFPNIEKTEFVNQGKFYHPTEKWEPVIYYGPSGSTIENGRVFQILKDWSRER